MLRWRNWRFKYVGVQDRALKLCPGTQNACDCFETRKSVKEAMFLFHCRSLNADVTRFLPVALRVKREDRKKMGKSATGLFDFLLRGRVSGLEIVFVGQCEVFVCLDFVDFFFFPLARETHRSANGVSIL